MAVNSDCKSTPAVGILTVYVVRGWSGIAGVKVSVRDGASYAAAPTTGTPPACDTTMHSPGRTDRTVLSNVTEIVVSKSTSPSRSSGDWVSMWFESMSLGDIGQV